MNQFTSKIQENLFLEDNFNFNEFALKLFDYQYEHNNVYRQFVDLLKIDKSSIDSYLKIPFLPISFYKTHKVISGNLNEQKIFESSGTTGQINSKHFVADLSLYEQSFLKAFQQFYGNIEDWIVLALLPSYLERDTSSLVYMADVLIRKTKSEHSGFYLYNYASLKDKLDELQTKKYSNKKILLLGVTFALLDFAEQYPMDLSNVIIMETGGMKGKRPEMLREEIHAILNKAFHTTNIHSEYGMTELLSQAYSFGNGIFQAPKWMKIVKRDIYNPMLVTENTGRGGLNVIDLANIHSCAFIATEDIVQIHSDNTFEVVGRIDNAAIRGCNLMVSM
ncbi:MAG: acyl transferase [Chitinophagales bacterium]